ncbi:MAG TPA: imidazole glycerol phosphate synthase subunit HisH [candidate division Zixibacteria bacterium]|nr:imidazole glycerol phosphate synthase subunit HisH [candidate division Zixibacteria bacterium]
MVHIVDYGMGNMGSILNMLKKIGTAAVISSKISDIEKAEKLILPGVGSFDNGISNLRNLGLVPILSDKVINDRIPILGICLGMQLLTMGSEEGALDGLGWLKAKTIRFNFDKTQTNLKVPHMGWNTVKIEIEDYLFRDMYQDARFYFVHSYHVVCDDELDVASKTHYGYDFISSVQKENIFGVQFHPEKSHKFGLKLLKNFAELR